MPTQLIEAGDDMAFPIPDVSVSPDNRQNPCQPLLGTVFSDVHCDANDSLTYIVNVIPLGHLMHRQLTLEGN